MRIQIASDIHLELGDREFATIIEPSAPNLALVGDICGIGLGNAIERRYIRFLRQCAKNFTNVFVLAGNHEYYTSIGLTMMDIEFRLEEICEMFDNVHFLQCKSIVIDDIRIIGATLWSSIPSQLERAAEETMTDYVKIFGDYDEKLTASASTDLHYSHLAFIQREMADAARNGQRSIVLTHHAPSLRCFWRNGIMPNNEADTDPTTPLEDLISELFVETVSFIIDAAISTFSNGLTREQNAALHACCCSDLEKLFRAENGAPVAWIYGHTHVPLDLQLVDTRVVTNPLGYTREPECQRAFRTRFIVEIPQSTAV